MVQNTVDPLITRIPRWTAQGMGYQDYELQVNFAAKWRFGRLKNYGRVLNFIAK